MAYKSRPITQPQKDLIVKLIGEKDLSSLNDEQRAYLANPDAWEVLDTKGAGKVIDALLALPKLPVQPTFEKGEGSSDKWESGLVPEGYFFIVDPTENDPEKVEKFYRVRHGKKDTRWEGYAFLDVQASDFFYPVKDANRRKEIIAEILKDPVKAMNEYGMRLGRCGVCNRTLTDRHSILRGIGPICAEKLSYTPTAEQLSMIEQIKQKYDKPTEGGE